MARSDGQHCDNTGVPGALNRGLAIAIELLIIQVAVGVDKSHLFKPRARRYVFQETGKHRRAAF